jgi:hypothetical protein
MMAMVIVMMILHAMKAVMREVQTEAVMKVGYSIA